MCHACYQTQLIEKSSPLCVHVKETCSYGGKRNNWLNTILFTIYRVYLIMVVIGEGNAGFDFQVYLASRLITNNHNDFCQIPFKHFNISQSVLENMSPPTSGNKTPQDESRHQRDNRK